MPILIRDYETRSTLDLPDVGAWRYSQHPSTNIWCCGYCVDDGEIKLWLPGDPVPAAFIEAANNPDWLVCAFNDQFERLLEQHILSVRYGFPLVPIERHRCLQASALARALPGSLDGAANALKLTQQKDTAGRWAMLQMAKPRRPRKSEDPNAILWFDDEERRQQLYAYCKRDVATERELHKQIPFLEGNEQALWILDQAINDRGVYIDRALLDAALRIAEQGRVEIDAELAKITAGEIDSVHQVTRLLEWLNGHGATLKNIGKKSLEKELNNGLPDTTRHVIQLRLDGAHAAANKLDTMRAWLNGDSRARGTLKFHGASTGRWSSYGIQLQNLKKPVVDDINQAIDAVASGSLERLRKDYPRPISVVGDITRGLICAAPGHRLIAGDLSGIESRVTAWVSGQKSKLDMWAKFDQTGDPKGEPYYLIGRMMGMPEEKARAIGKIADLAFGYQGGVGAWRKLAPDDPASDEHIKQLQHRWHDAHPHTKDFWKAINAKAVTAVGTPHRKVVFQRPQWRHVAFESNGSFLFMHLPSGRKIAYPQPYLRTDPQRNTVSVVFMDTGLHGWSECRNGFGAYGGTWVENAVQAISRDILTDAMLRLEAAGYKIVLHVHDEVVAEVPDGFGNTEEFQRLITTPPTWAADLPLAAKVRNGARFCKSNAKPIEPNPIEELIEPTIKPPHPEPEPESEEPKPEPEQPAAEEAKAEQPKSEHHGSKFEAEQDTYAEEHADEPFNDAFLRRHYNLAKTFDYVLPDASLLYWQNRYELKPGIPPTKKRKRKRFLAHRPMNGRDVFGAGERRVLYNWPAIMRAGPGSTVIVTEGEANANACIEKGLLATTVLSHDWAPECVAALTDRHLTILEDHDDDGVKIAANAQKALAPVAGSSRIVPTEHLWKHLPKNARPLRPGDDVQDWLRLGGDPAKLIEVCCEIPIEDADPLLWHGEPDPRGRRKWRVRALMPAEGVGLLAGQWGFYKTFMAIELILSVIKTGQSFCGRSVVEPCGVLVLATEGAFEIKDRIDAAVQEKYPDMAKAPISWRESCPTLLAPGVVTLLIRKIQEAAAEMQARFKLPLGLVIIDVLADAAGYMKAGDENDPAVGQKLMSVMRKASKACGCFILAVDHFGKTIESGTRGASSKEGSADLVLACLGQREVSGAVVDTRLALRKVRGGPSGQEFPFNVRLVPIPEPSEDNESEVTFVIDWGAPATSKAAKDPWEADRQSGTKLAMKALRRAMMKLLATHGTAKTIEPGLPAVMVIDQELVRDEFYASTVVPGDTPKQKQTTKRQRFHRALERAETQNLIGQREIEGVTYLWFIEQ